MQDKIQVLFELKSLLDKNKRFFLIQSLLVKHRVLF